MPDRILDLSELGYAPARVKLPGGLDYEMLGAADLGPVAGARFQRISGQIQALGDIGAETSDDTALELERLSRELTRIICPDMTAEVAASLPMRYHYRIQQHFLALTTEDLPDMVAEDNPPTTPT